jgi:hypothetical protein
MFQSSEDNLMEEAETFLRTLQTKLDEQAGIYSEFKQQHLKWYENFNVFQRDFSKYNEEVNKNLKKIQENKDLMNPGFDISKLVNKIFKNKKDFALPDWFVKNFFFEENAKFKENLAFFSEKLLKARFTDDFCHTRQRISDDLRGQIEKVMNIFVDENNIDSFYLLSVKDITKGTAEIKLYDNVIQDFVWQIISKTIDYINNVILDFKTFRENSKTSMTKLKEIKFEGDEYYLIELNNITKRNPQEVRVKRYDLILTNESLCTLQQGKTLDENILPFIMEYLKERNSKLDMEKFNKIYVNHASFFRKLMPQGVELDYNRINHDAVKLNTERHNGINHTIFHCFDKILYLVDLDSENWMVVEINNMEIIVYDSNHNYTGNIHEKIIEIFRAYMVEELKNKGDMNEEDSLIFERNYLGRSAWCPQVSEESQKTLFALMNMKYLAEGADISSKHYAFEDIMKFRLSLFSLLMRIGQSKESILNFELLV